MTKKEINKLYAEDLKRFRKKLNMSQAEFATMLNLSPRTISNWECRGCPEVPHALLLQLELADELIEKLKKQLKDNNMIFQL